MDRVFGFHFNEIKLNDASDVHINAKETGIEQVQLLRTGTFNHAVFGALEVTPITLRSLKRNYDLGVRRVDLAIDYFHESNKVAAGWINAVELREDDTELWIKVEWTKTAQQKLHERELRYLSADFSFKYIDTETGIFHGPTLFGGGLTNRPHVKDMNPILNEYKGEDMDFEQMLEAMKRLTPEQKKQIMEMLSLELEPKVEPVEPKEEVKEEIKEEINKEELEGDEMENKKLSEELERKEIELSELKTKVELAEKKTAFTTMLAEGKVNPAQEEAFIAGDMAKFAENAEAVNLNEKGTGAISKDGDKKEKTNGELEDEAIELAEKQDGDFNVNLKEVLKEKRFENIR